MCLCYISATRRRQPVTDADVPTAIAGTDGDVVDASVATSSSATSMTEVYTYCGTLGDDTGDASPKYNIGLTRKESVMSCFHFFFSAVVYHLYHAA
ncbi:unnamed protein product [Heligmosomoides polygyrus]|uniref:Secreted protein n=1 Tax=Heligmosomoides polygyrus TaxID=6339 RepID=A0A183G820_HELPZ|nr:unnamed protein product [Heligmosomoides polygyrus]